MRACVCARIVRGNRAILFGRGKKICRIMADKMNPSLCVSRSPTLQRVRACVCVRVRAACVRACERACVRACVFVCEEEESDQSKKARLDPTDRTRPDKGEGEEKVQ